jgi:hypothetical protein
MAARRPVLVVPGGGPFADAVRAIDEQVGLADSVAHALALRAMDQLGVLLAPLLPGAQRLGDLVAPPALALLLAEPAFANRPEVPESWAVTSDSLAVLAAAAIGAEQVVLLKPVAGVLPSWPSDDPDGRGGRGRRGGRGGREPIPLLTATELQALQARGGGRVVDSYLPEAVRRTGIPVVVRRPGPDHPASTGGTRIIPG